MRAAFLAALACTAAMGDETIDTYFAWDAESFTGGWKKAGQVLTVPQGAPTLASFSFSALEWGEGGGSYIVSLYEWDDELEHTVGPNLWFDTGEIPDDLEIQTHEIGVTLDPGSQVVVVVNMTVDEVGASGVGLISQDVYEGGGLVLTFGSVDEPWGLTGAALEMAFTAAFCGCPADVDGDGVISILDFVAFQSLFVSGDAAADCNGDGMLNILDFICYQALFEAGC